MARLQGGYLVAVVQVRGKARVAGHVVEQREPLGHGAFLRAGLAGAVSEMANITAITKAVKIKRFLPMEDLLVVLLSKFPCF